MKYWEVSSRWCNIREVEMDDDPTAMFGDVRYFRTFREAKASLLKDLQSQKAEIEKKLDKVRALRKN